MPTLCGLLRRVTRRRPPPTSPSTTGTSHSHAPSPLSTTSLSTKQHERWSTSTTQGTTTTTELTTRYLDFKFVLEDDGTGLGDGLGLSDDEEKEVKEQSSVEEGVQETPDLRAAIPGTHTSSPALPTLVVPPPSPTTSSSDHSEQPNSPTFYATPPSSTSDVSPSVTRSSTQSSSLALSRKLSRRRFSTGSSISALSAQSSSLSLPSSPSTLRISSMLDQDGRRVLISRRRKSVDPGPERCRRVKKVFGVGDDDSDFSSSSEAEMGEMRSSRTGVKASYSMPSVVGGASSSEADDEFETLSSSSGSGVFDLSDHGHRRRTSSPHHPSRRNSAPPSSFATLLPRLPSSPRPKFPPPPLPFTPLPRNYSTPPPQQQIVILPLSHRSSIHQRSPPPSPSRPPSPTQQFAFPPNLLRRASATPSSITFELPPLREATTSEVEKLRRRASMADPSTLDGIRFHGGRYGHQRSGSLGSVVERETGGKWWEDEWAARENGEERGRGLLQVRQKRRAVRVFFAKLII